MLQILARDVAKSRGRFRVLARCDGISDDLRVDALSS